MSTTDESKVSVSKAQGTRCYVKEVMESRALQSWWRSQLLRLRSPTAVWMICCVRRNVVLHGTLSAFETMILLVLRVCLSI